MNKKKKIILIVLAVLLSITLVLVGTFFVLTWIGKSQFHDGDTHISNSAVKVEDESTITYNGKKYVLNDNIVSILVIGIDRDNIDENLGSGKNGQADVIFLATLDTETDKTTIIPISREAMVDVNLYTTDGKYAGVKREQLCLAYAYGNNTEASCENVMTSVRRLLYGININSYVAIEMEGVEKLTDLVGGVEITSLETLNTKKLPLNKGEKTTLNGNDSRIYIAYRDDDVEANSRRMARQKQFLSALMNKVGNAVVNDFSKLSEYYDTLDPYYFTNISFAQTTYLAQNSLSFNFGDSLIYKSIDGELLQGEKWVEFEANEESILQTIIDVFYVPKK